MEIPKVSHRPRAHGARPRSRRIALIYDARSAYDTKGLRHFAFCRYPASQINGWSSKRQDSFKAELARRGYLCRVYPAKIATEATCVSLHRSLDAWLRSLPKPVGILASNDIRGGRSWNPAEIAF